MPGDGRRWPKFRPTSGRGTAWPGASASSMAITSLGWVTSVARPCRMSSFGPMLAALVTGPGTAPTPRPRSRAARTVLIDPDRTPASGITVAPDSAASSRFRAMNRCLVGADPGGTSLTSRPTSPTRFSSSL